MLNPSEVHLGEEIEEMQKGLDRKNVSKLSHYIWKRLFDGIDWGRPLD